MEGDGGDSSRLLHKADDCACEPLRLHWRPLRQTIMPE